MFLLRHGYNLEGAHNQHALGLLPGRGRCNTFVSYLSNLFSKRRALHSSCQTFFHSQRNLKFFQITTQNNSFSPVILKKIFSDGDVTIFTLTLLIMHLDFIEQNSCVDLVDLEAYDVRSSQLKIT